MTATPNPLDLSRVKVFPLRQRRSLARVEQVLLDPDTAPPSIDGRTTDQVHRAAGDVAAARKRGSAVILIYGAHLLRNGAARILERLMAGGWLTHLATNGAGSIHDWEFAWMGASTESVEEGVAAGCFGTWDETSRYIHLALLAGGLQGLGYGTALGKFIHEDGTTLPSPADLERAIREHPTDPLTPARADLLLAMRKHDLPPGRTVVEHAWKEASILAQAYRLGVPATVHPGIGYDIISNHPIFNGAALGRAGEADFKLFAGSVGRLEGGVVLNVGSAIMGPQVFEKSLSCVNNLRLQEGRPVVAGHAIHVVDLQDGGHWDWSQGEPPKSNPAYYLRFCKSFSRMGGTMHYLQCDNAAFIHHLYHNLKQHDATERGSPR